MKASNITTEMKNQTIGVEVEMNNLVRAKAANRFVAINKR